MMVAGVWKVSATEILCDTVTIRFRVNRTEINPHIDNNREALDAFLTKTMERLSDTTLTLTSLTVVGGASPEGNVELNRRLSQRRAESLCGWYSEISSAPDSLKQFKFLGRDWDGLRQRVEGDTLVPYRDEVLQVLQYKSLSRLKQLRGSEPYKYLLRNHFASLRASMLIAAYGRKQQPAPEPEPVPEQVDTFADVLPDRVIVRDTVYLERIVYQCQERKPLYMAVKTDMLQDALLTPNIGLEFYLGKMWSIGADWHYAWWRNDRRHRYWRNYGADLYVRRWWGRRAEDKPLTGHHIGAYGQVFTYDIEWGGRGYMGGKPGGDIFDRANYAFGLEYGYSLPIARHFNIDFTLGVGYWGGKHLEYVPKDGCYVWEKTKQRHYFGPTRLEISLVWLLGHGNFNRRKEVAQ